MVDGLAAANIVLCVPGVTFAVVSLGSFPSLGVFTRMAASARRIALISVNANPRIICTEHLPGGTDAQQALGSLEAAIRAASLSAGAIVVITKRSFVGTVGTIQIIVAHFVLGDADAREGFSRAAPSIMRARDGLSDTGLLLKLDQYIKADHGLELTKQANP